MKICLFDPGISDNSGALSSNYGDLIIQEAVNRELSELFNHPKVLSISSHTIPDNRLISETKECSHIFVGGTNLISSNMNINRQWRISARQILRMNGVILLGVGWNSYQSRPNFYTRLFLYFLLSKKYMHSVRDEYTKNMFESIGINNVLNTGCPSAWPLADINMSEIGTKKSENVLFMLTDYNQDPENDNRLIDILSENYKNLYFWPQGSDDLKYLTILPSYNSEIHILDRSLKSFRNFLTEKNDVDYVGTRLHGGIKCLLNRKRSLILEIDNRAAEIGKDINLHTVKRSDFDNIVDWINNPRVMNIKINTDAINTWKDQFCM